jgi:quercetin dioxygenase-like cupin family protein
MLLVVEGDEVALLSSRREHHAMTITSSPPAAGFSVAPGDGERIWSVGETITVKAGGERTGGTLVVLENLVPPGGGPPPHAHTREDEFLYVLTGRFDVRIGDQLHALAPGGFAYMPRGTIHTFSNASATASRILIGFTPGGIEGFFREAGSRATDDGPAPPVDDDEIARTLAAAAKHGTQLVGVTE